MKGLYDNLPIFYLYEQESLEEIQLIVDQSGGFGLLFYFFSDHIFNQMKIITDRILDRGNRTDMKILIHEGMKEIVTNGVKANIKRIVFESHSMDLNCSSQTEIGMRHVKRFLLDHKEREVERLLRESGLWLCIYFIIENDGIRIEVVNNTELSELEEKRIRSIFRKSHHYHNLMEFMDDHGDNLEGAGLGLFMLVLMLRRMGVDPAYFRVGKTGTGFTRSRVEIPFNKNYTGVREQKT